MNKYNNLKPFRDEGRTYGMRQWINVAFLLLSVVGVGVYFLGWQTAGLYIVGLALVLKFIELTLRILKL